MRKPLRITLNVPAGALAGQPTCCPVRVGGRVVGFATIEPTDTGYVAVLDAAAETAAVRRNALQPLTIGFTTGKAS